MLVAIHHGKRGIDLLGRSIGMVSSAPDPAKGGAMRVVASVGHEYDERHRRRNARREDGTHWDYGYNNRSEVTSAIKKLADYQLVLGQSFGYDYDGMGNRKTSSAGTGSGVATTTYAPDALNRYTGVTTPSAIPGIATPGFADILVRTPNSVTNPVTVTVAGVNTPVTRQGNLLNAHATIANSPNGSYYGVTVTDGTTTRTGSRWLAPASVSLQYDDDGNLTQDGRWTYTWDAENRLVRLDTLASAITAGAPALTLNYTYDYLGRRIGKTVTTAGTPATTTGESTLYEGWNPVATFSSGTLTKTLLWGLDLSGTPQGAGGVGGLLAVTDHAVSPAECYLPSYDTNGNIIAWTDSTGQLIRRQDYDPFGNTLLREEMVTRPGLDETLTHGFSTKPTDSEPGLLYYGYRFYDPVTGRWASRDPIEEDGGVNLYGFVSNSPVATNDALGMAPVFRTQQVMTIDADGAPMAYKADGTGLDALTNGGFPTNRVKPDATYDTCPYGVECERLKNGKFRPYVQGKNGAIGPAPGYFISGTAWRLRRLNDQYSFVDSSAIPYIVVSRKADLGKLASIVDMRGSIPIVNHGVAADFNGQTKGEASIAMAQLFGISGNPRNGGSKSRKFCYIIYDQKTSFPGSHAGVEAENQYGLLPKNKNGIPCGCLGSGKH